MKRIGVISDTPSERACSILKEIASKHFSGVDLIIHAGDMVSLGVLDALILLG